METKYFSASFEFSRPALEATSSKLSKTAEARDAEARARQSLLQALKQLRTDLESSQKKACKLQEQLVDLESLSLEN